MRLSEPSREAREGRESLIRNVSAANGWCGEYRDSGSGCHRPERQLESGPDEGGAGDDPTVGRGGAGGACLRRQPEDVAEVRKVGADAGEGDRDTRGGERAV